MEDNYYYIIIFKNNNVGMLTVKAQYRGRSYGESNTGRLKTLRWWEGMRPRAHPKDLVFEGKREPSFAVKRWNVSNLSVK